VEFSCDGEAVPVQLEGGRASLSWPNAEAADIRLNLHTWDGDDTLRGEGYVQTWAEEADTTFEARRIDPSLLP
jgi:hypothetical protein